MVGARPAEGQTLHIALNAVSSSCDQSQIKPLVNNLSLLSQKVPIFGDFKPNFLLLW